MRLPTGSMFQCICAVIMVFAAIISVHAEYCYSQDNERPQSAHMCTKTVYARVKGPENGQQFIVPGVFLIHYRII